MINKLIFIPEIRQMQNLIFTKTDEYKHNANTVCALL